MSQVYESILGSESGLFGCTKHARICPQCFFPFLLVYHLYFVLEALCGYETVDISHSVCQPQLVNLDGCTHMLHKVSPQVGGFI